jgi:23S rRNA (cytidine1920-2'-O)/16S rRNA (cytidine1409-2'-O)-methyltransferase
MTSDDARPGYVSRGGVKLAAALDAFAIDPEGWRCADLGCSVGGFTDCLLQRGAAPVYAVDTQYGQLAWKLRQDERVVVMERTNAVHADPPPDATAACDLAVIDLGWTKLAKAVPAALRWLSATGAIVALVKPHYESGEHRLDDAHGHRVSAAAADDAARANGLSVAGLIDAPIRGSKGGNLEQLAWLTRVR